MMTLNWIMLYYFMILDISLLLHLQSWCCATTYLCRFS